MDDPWDVKSVRQAGDYISCLKLHGVPLLPPVLSKECRDEMRYYKILAQEVEKRISLIQPCFSDSEVEEMQRAESPELCDFDHGEHTSSNGEQSSTDVNATINVQFNHSNNLELNKYSHNNHDHNSEHTKEIHISSPSPDGRDSQRSTLVMDISLHIKKNTHESCSSGKGSPELYLPIEDVPERDYEWKKKELLSDVDSYSSKTRESLYSPVKESPQKLSGMFTGSLNDLYCKNVQNSSTLMRQRSYTLIEPGPMLLAHLAVESLNTGVDMNCISMSESLSNVSFSPTRKRRSWDLESAKVKWSSMALELKQNIIPKPQAEVAKAQVEVSKPQVEVSKPQVEVSKPQVEVPKPQGHSKPLKRPRAQSVIDKRPIVLNKVTKPSPVSEPINRTSKPNSPIKRISPVRTLTNRTLTKANPIQSPKKLLKAPEDPVSPNLENEDPATRVRQLYDKIQQQQMSQMSSLIEKQKQEKILLKQIFEEQNNMLFKQLKSICPESPIEVKRAWGKTEHGPVKLSQLIGEPQADIGPPPVKNTPNSKSVERPKRSVSQRNKTSAFSQGHDNVTPASARSGRSEQCDGSITRTHSPASGAARQLSYDSEAPLTDHTGDTLQDLNVTFPTDSENSTRRGPRASPRSRSQRDTHAAIQYMEQSIHNSINGVKEQNTQKERDAATRIVACARGWLVRRLMRTERVRATVQTIRDALLCALQLHTDARGIRGADVDLHRRLIQQITAACYSLHETFISSTPAERCAIIAADRGRRRSLAAKISPKVKQRDIMSQSHSGAFPARPKRAAPSLMTQSSYEVYPNDKCHRTRYMPSPRRRPWR